MRNALVAALWLSLAESAAAAECNQATVDVCFRPGPVSCAAWISDAINGARQSVLVLAYGFTSAPIAKAVADAAKRGVAVRVVLDRSNESQHYSAATFIANAGIPLRIDRTVAIAHNKVIVIDGELVVTGSYNFTKAAEERNAENAVFIRDRCTAAKYGKAFEERWSRSDAGAG